MRERERWSHEKGRKGDIEAELQRDRYEERHWFRCIERITLAWREEGRKAEIQ